MPQLWSALMNDLKKANHAGPHHRRADSRLQTSRIDEVFAQHLRKIPMTNVLVTASCELLYYYLRNARFISVFASGSSSHAILEAWSVRRLSGKARVRLITGLERHLRCAIELMHECEGGMLRVWWGQSGASLE